MVKYTDKSMFSGYLWKLTPESRSTNSTYPHVNHSYGSRHTNRERSRQMQTNLSIIENMTRSKLPLLLECVPQENRQMVKFRSLHEDLSKSVRNFNYLKHREEILYRISQTSLAFAKRMKKIERLTPAADLKSTARSLRNPTRKRGEPYKPSPLRNVMSTENISEMEKILARDVDGGFHDTKVDQLGEAKNKAKSARKLRGIGMRFALS